MRITLSPAARALALPLVLTLTVAAVGCGVLALSRAPSYLPAPPRPAQLATGPSPYGCPTNLLDPRSLRRTNRARIRLPGGSVGILVTITP